MAGECGVWGHPACALSRSAPPDMVMKALRFALDGCIRDGAAVPALPHPTLNP